MATVILEKSIGEALKKRYDLDEALVGYNEDENYLFIRTKDKVNEFPANLHLYRFPLDLNAYA